MIAFNTGFGRIGSSVAVDNVPADGLEFAIHESCVEFEQLRSKTAIAFANVYEGYMLDSTKDSAEKEAIFEGLVGNVFDKIKEFFKKLGAKIKSWFINIKRYLESWFMNNKKFVEKYRNELTSKDLSKFTYDGGHEWKMGQANKFEKAADEAVKEAEKKVKDVIGEFKSDNWDVAASYTSNNANADDYTDAKVKKDIDDKTGYANTSKFKEAMNKELRGKEKTLKNVSSQDLIDKVVNEKDTLDEINETVSNISDDIDKAVDAIDKFQDHVKKLDAGTEEDAKTKKSKVSSMASRAAGWFRHGISYRQAFLTQQQALLKEEAGEAMSVLRSILSYKPANESWSAARESSTASILDSYGY